MALKREVLSLEGTTLVAFYYLNASDKRVGWPLVGGVLYEGDYHTNFSNNKFLYFFLTLEKKKIF